ncbi:hypothetical protein EOK75_04045 [Pseudorhodobacter turbinis]|uniref:Uncharacterized protein n=1 Tax=Pseudorhodobacter turbinis TaxID=2500533 RepID=A0A4P8EE13_9RHOB|nr:hypothetical protein [Pseudorhodobacter turbinis]QCO55028.1 hypothetical protein EOK75_04045 [Pseudorhodobacter turbinis]
MAQIADVGDAGYFGKQLEHLAHLGDGLVADLLLGLERREPFHQRRPCRIVGVDRCAIDRRRGDWALGIGPPARLRL